MFIIRVIMTVKPDEAPAFVEYLQKEAADVKAQFAGCEQFGLFADVSAENRYLLYEEWETQAAFNAYRNSDFFKQNSAVLFPMMAGAPDSAYFSAEIIPS